MEEQIARRILVIDDSDAIHSDFRKILADETESSDLDSARTAFLGQETVETARTSFELATASQGEQGIKMVLQARRSHRPFAMAFVDVRMPPGLDGIETIERLWKIQPDLQVVICTAFADYSFEEIIERLGATDNLLILKKPFEPVEVRQMASALTDKWHMRLQERERMIQLGEAEREAREFAFSQAETNRALEEANRAARAASRAKSDFLANMSHEIRTPMNAILGYLDLLFESIDATEEQTQFIDTVKQSGAHLMMIVDDVLDISRIEAGKLTIVTESVLPAELSREVVSICHASAKQKGLSLTLTIDNDVPETIQSDPNRLRQILLNLVGNAVKFTEAGSVELELGFESGPTANNRLRFRVRDTGTGIAEADQESLFDPFTQVDSSLTRHIGGTGLGLAISQRLAFALNGEVAVESELGTGSCFDLLLNIDQSLDSQLSSESSPSATKEAAVAPSEVRPASPGNLSGSVLVVEDVAVNQLLIQTILQKAGAKVTVVENGLLACEAVEAATTAGNPFELILMDMQMPVMDGYEATRKLREDGFTTPIIALTAHAMTTDRDRCLEAGCDDYITKPVDRGALITACANLMPTGPAPALPASPTIEQLDDDQARSSSERTQ